MAAWRGIGVGYLVVFLAAAVPGTGAAESRNLAPGFVSFPKGATIAVMPPDIELFAMSAGGVEEPRADWTEAALKNVRLALDRRAATLSAQLRPVSESEGDEWAEINALHAAVARSIALHHLSGSMFALPTKAGKLDWSLGEAVAPVRTQTGGDYGLFIWIRDSYTTAERKLTMAAMALLGVGLVGGSQVGYASLVDLHSGRILWFNKLARGSGDLREADPAAESVDALLAGFPEAQ